MQHDGFTSRLLKNDTSVSYELVFKAIYIFPESLKNIHMLLIKNEISDSEAMNILRKSGLFVSPGDLIEVDRTVDEIEKLFSSYIKNFKTEDADYQIYTYENLETLDGEQNTFMVILDVSEKRFIYIV